METYNVCHNNVTKEKWEEMPCGNYLGRTCYSIDENVCPLESQPDPPSVTFNGQTTCYILLQNKNFCC